MGSNLRGSRCSRRCSAYRRIRGMDSSETQARRGGGGWPIKVGGKGIRDFQLFGPKSITSPVVFDKSGASLSSGIIFL